MLETKTGSKSDSLNVVILFALLGLFAINIKVLMYQIDLQRKVANKDTGKYLGLIEYEYVVDQDTITEHMFTERFFKHNNAVTATMIEMDVIRKDSNVLNLVYQILED
jgi:hypothetical protein